MGVRLISCADVQLLTSHACDYFDRLAEYAVALGEAALAAIEGMLCEMVEITLLIVGAIVDAVIWALLAPVVAALTVGTGGAWTVLCLDVGLDGKALDVDTGPTVKQIGRQLRDEVASGKARGSARVFDEWECSDVH